MQNQQGNNKSLVYKYVIHVIEYTETDWMRLKCDINVFKIIPKTKQLNFFGCCLSFFFSLILPSILPVSFLSLSVLFYLAWLT